MSNVRYAKRNLNISYKQNIILDLLNQDFMNGNDIFLILSIEWKNYERKKSYFVILIGIGMKYPTD